ncbi:hypothetical protein HBH98_200450 [Parastagonospora nodorum]|uniref:Uncharacterized protein n=1 Tax=Phaeosphaeria nodorum (strain SN15 / ATCC MYA-4574 / FGSC 10173) TaxID=321614 RepID=A0A7U2I4U5_PHANO|nr:hypothetical protein HBH54_194470 [Parastagonospora nodorum]QRC99432.1 hypothetical protein JI435_308930 [Parastagonospora nodorum SN15]KAH3940187.1 hypothetical protein HBH53_222060 [Parastagonospora nodorum]KAH4012271.1 hypothetical protein HBI13_191080 [Parastagonospora nodorum]KAH4061842.1 hypothetical protein HBH50_216150 [Parastagonospora nodorum]
MCANGRSCSFIRWDVQQGNLKAQPCKIQSATCRYCNSSNARVNVTQPLSVRHRRLERSWRSHAEDLVGVASCMTRFLWWKRASVRASAHGSSTEVESHLAPPLQLCGVHAWCLC